MNIENTEETHDDNAAGRPLGFWLRTVDALISREFAAAFDGEGATRRDWMLLNAVSGDVDVPGFAQRFARKGGKRLRGLEQRGWVEEAGDGTWALTEEGRAAKERLGGIVDDIRSRIAGAVSPEDFATTLASLEAIARELGWDESDTSTWPGFGPGRGWGRGLRPGFGPRAFGHDIHHDFGPNLHRGFRPGFGPGGGPTGMPDAQAHFAHHHSHHGHGDCQEDGRHGHHGHRGDHGHGRHGQGAESAYERGFDAGFSRGRSEAV
jgi:hypothetical protein